MAKYQPAAIERAKKEGIFLFNFELDGKHAKKDSVSYAGPLSKELADKVWELFKEIMEANSKGKAGA